MHLIGLLIITPVHAVENIPQSSPISSYTAISQNGGFSVSYFSPLNFDNEATKKHVNYITYRSVASNSQIMIGPILEETELEFICKNPRFLQVENISMVFAIRDEDIFYFDIDQFKGCIINFDANKAVLIAEIPKTLISKRKNKIRYIGIAGLSNDIKKLLFNISFSLSAEEIFINILQITQAYSAFSDQIAWESIYSQGIEFIGVEQNPCKGWLAAKKFLDPELNNPDLNSRFDWIRNGLLSCNKSET